MRTVSALAAVAIATLLSACSPAASSADEKSFRAEAAASAVPNDEEQQPVLDAQGNELDPQLADAVREKMEEDKAALGSGEGDASAPSDTGAPAADDEGN